MSKAGSVLAVDLGASSGRAMIGRLADGKLAIEELHRFPNDPVQVGNRLHWDILRLLHEIKQALLKAKHESVELQSMAIDSWAVDFGLIGPNDELLANPYHYRDHHTDGVMEEVCGIVGKEKLFKRTGIQFLPFNTLYQLYAMKKAGSPALEQANTLLMIPDLLRFFLTGEKKSEYTNATTTQMLHAVDRQWDTELLEELGIPTQMLLPTNEPGAEFGRLSASLCDELAIPSIPVIGIGEHDTASAVAAVPAEHPFAYLISGTWSLLGSEISQPVLTGQALDWNFTNEGGVGGTYRLLKNIMGLWLIQECRRSWDIDGRTFSFAGLVEQSMQAKPFQSFIDPDHAAFLNPSHMPSQIQQYCRDTNQIVPQTEGEIIRCVMESLAMKYRFVLDKLELLTGERYKGLHMVGGGIQNAELCQFTANAIGRPVIAGPVEASSIGNIVMQMIAMGQIGSLKEAREIIKNSFPVTTYEPERTEVWGEKYRQFTELVGGID